MTLSSTPPTRAQSAARVATLVAFNLILLLAVVVILEAAFGGWFDDTPINRLNLVRDRVLHFSTINLYESSSGVATYTRDAYGLRGDFGSPSRITLLTVGGSTTDQRYISDGHTWQDVLQRLLRESGRNVTIGNAGVDGQSTFGHLKNFDWWFPYVPDLKPGFILYYIGVNDFYKGEGSKFDELVTPGERRSIRQMLHEESALYRLAYTLYGLYQARVLHHAGHGGVDLKALTWTRMPSRRDHADVTERHLVAYGTRLRALLARTREFGARSILVTQPTRWHRFDNGVLEGVTALSAYGAIQINGVDRYYMMRLLDSTTCRIAAEFDAPCIDLAAAVPWSDGDFYDFAHMTPSGVTKVGHLLSAALGPIIDEPHPTSSSNRE